MSSAKKLDFAVFCLVFVLLMLAISVFAQQPTLLSLQGKLVNSSTGAKISSADLRININDSSGIVFNQNYSNAVSNGIFDLTLGSTYQLNLSYNEEYNLSIFVNNDSQLGEPYAFRGGQGQVGGGDIAETESFVFGNVSVTGNVSVGGNFSVDTNVLFVDAENNRVGIGNTIPNNTLDVSGNVNISGIFYAGSANITGSIKADGLNITGTSENSTFMGDIQILGTLYSGSPLKVSGGLNVTNGNTSFDDNTLFIDYENNRIGIGTDSPNVTLDVSGDANVSGYLEVGSGMNVSNGMNVLSGKVGIGTASPGAALDIGGAGSYLYFSCTAGGGDEGVLYKDSGGSARYGLWFPGSNEVRLSNRGSNGFVQIAANTGTGGSGGEVIVSKFEDNQITMNVDTNITTNLNVEKNLTVQSIHEINLGGDIPGTYYETQYLQNYILEINSTMSDDAVMIPNDILINYCGDIDGCILRGIMHYYDASYIPGATNGASFSYDPVRYTYRLETFVSEVVAVGTDGDSTETVLWNIGSPWNACYLKDGNVIAGSNQDDAEYGIWWHWSTNGYNVAQKICVLVIED